MASSVDAPPVATSLPLSSSSSLTMNNSKHHPNHHQQQQHRQRHNSRFPIKKNHQNNHPAVQNSIDTNGENNRHQYRVKSQNHGSFPGDRRYMIRTCTSHSTTSSSSNSGDELSDTSSHSSLSSSETITPAWTSSSLSTLSSFSHGRSTNHHFYNNQKRSNDRRRDRPTKYKNKNERRYCLTDLTSGEQGHQYLAMDCEMVGVGPDGLRSALARVVIVDWNGQVVLDQFVRPSEPVTDYRTFVSGITAADLQQGNAVDFDTCRQQIWQLLHQGHDKVGNSIGKIVIGHGLENDFAALGIWYPWYLIRDTAEWEPFMKTRTKSTLTGSTSTRLDDKIHNNNNNNNEYSTRLWPRKLRELCQEKLHRDIQTVGQAHCPKEDALAALDLYKLEQLKWEIVMQDKISQAQAFLWAETRQQQLRHQQQEYHQQQRLAPRQQKRPNQQKQRWRQRLQQMDSSSEEERISQQQ